MLCPQRTPFSALKFTRSVQAFDTGLRRNGRAGSPAQVPPAVPPVSGLLPRSLWMSASRYCAWFSSSRITACRLGEPLPSCGVVLLMAFWSRDRASSGLPLWASTAQRWIRHSQALLTSFAARKPFSAASHSGTDCSYEPLLASSAAAFCARSAGQPGQLSPGRMARAEAMSFASSSRALASAMSFATVPAGGRPGFLTLEPSTSGSWSRESSRTQVLLSLGAQIMVPSSMRTWYAAHIPSSHSGLPRLNSSSAERIPRARRSQSTERRTMAHLRAVGHSHQHLCTVPATHWPMSHSTRSPTSKRSAVRSLSSAENDMPGRSDDARELCGSDGAQERSRWKSAACSAAAPHTDSSMFTWLLVAESPFKGWAGRYSKVASAEVGLGAPEPPGRRLGARESPAGEHWRANREIDRSL